MKNSLIVILFISSLLISCGQLTGDSTGANIFEGVSKSIGGVAAIDVGNSTYVFDGVANKGGNAPHLYRIEFELPDKERLAFVLHGNKSLETGGEFIFERLNGEVQLLIKLNGKEHKIPLQVFKESQLIDVDIDFHNDHSDTHIIVWQSSGSHSDEEGCSFNGGCLYNTEDYALDYWLGVGKASGPFWGVIGNKNLVKTINGPYPSRSKL
jgi:hypothetical protein